MHILCWPCSCYWLNVYRKRKLKLRVSNQIVASKCCLYWGALLTVTEIKHLNWNTIHNMRGDQGKWNAIPIEYCDWGMVWKFMGKWVQGRSDYNNKIEENFNSMNYILCLSKFLSTTVLCKYTLKYSRIFLNFLEDTWNVYLNSCSFLSRNLFFRNLSVTFQI